MAVDLAVTDDVIWVESWNGLWRVDHSERPLDHAGGRRRATQSLDGLFVADSETQRLAGSHIWDLATGGRGRVWVVSDRALAVVEPNGRRTVGPGLAAPAHGPDRAHRRRPPRKAPRLPAAVARQVPSKGEDLPAMECSCTRAGWDQPHELDHYPTCASRGFDCRHTYP